MNSQYQIVPPQGGSGTSKTKGTDAPASVIQKLFAVPFKYAPSTVDVKDRLDTVVGIAGWQTCCQVFSGSNIQCKLSVKIEGEWVSKEGFGGNPYDAFLRAAAEFGISRIEQ